MHTSGIQPQAALRFGYFTRSQKKALQSMNLPQNLVKVLEDHFAPMSEATGQQNQLARESMKTVFADGTHRSLQSLLNKSFFTGYADGFDFWYKQLQFDKTNPLTELADNSGWTPEQVVDNHKMWAMRSALPVITVFEEYKKAWFKGMADNAFHAMAQTLKHVADVCSAPERTIP